MRKIAVCWVFAAFCLTLVGASASDRIRIATQRTGTFAWELDVIRARGLDREADLDLVVTELASPEAGKIGLKGGSADLIVADVMWVTRERALGGSLQFYPYSTTLGAIMTSASSGINGLDDLKGRKLGIAGGALDKSWLLFQAWARARGFDPRKDAQIVYGAPQLLAVKLEQGELDAVLNYWNLCAELEAKGFRRAIEMSTVERDLGATGPVSMVGYAFEQAFAISHGAALQRYFKIAARAREILAESPAEWTRIAARIGVSDANTLAVIRKRYAAGAPRRTLGEEETDARRLYHVLATVGGTDLVGPARELSPGLYWRPGPGG